MPEIAKISEPELHTLSDGNFDPPWNIFENKWSLYGHSNRDAHQHEKVQEDIRDVRYHRKRSSKTYAVKKFSTQPNNRVSGPSRAKGVHNKRHREFRNNIETDPAGYFIFRKRGKWNED